MIKLELGRRYKLPHGTGVLLGHEEFYDNGMKSRRVNAVNPIEGSRHIFMLDEGHTWKMSPYPYTFEPKEYCAWGDDIEELE